MHPMKPRARWPLNCQQTNGGGNGSGSGRAVAARPDRIRQKIQRTRQIAETLFSRAQECIRIESLRTRQTHNLRIHLRCVDDIRSLFSPNSRFILHKRSLHSLAAMRCWPKCRCPDSVNDKQYGGRALAR